jgi:hypothetical protein
MVLPPKVSWFCSVFVHENRQDVADIALLHATRRWSLCDNIFRYYPFLIQNAMTQLQLESLGLIF